MPRVSVLTVTKRVGWEKDAIRSLERQTFQDFEWVIVTENIDEHPEWQPTELDMMVIPAPPKTKTSNLNASNNEGLRHCSGELIIFYQDFIKLPPDCIQKLVEDYDETNAFITTATIEPDGNYDGRYHGIDALRKCTAPEWEENVALAPLEAIKALGGYDERYDDGWAWNNCNVAERAEILGYQFYIDETVNPQLIYHKKEPELDPNLPLNGGIHATTMWEIRNGVRPLKVDYL